MTIAISSGGFSQLDEAAEIKAKSMNFIMIFAGHIELKLTLKGDALAPWLERWIYN